MHQLEAKELEALGLAVALLHQQCLVAEVGQLVVDTTELLLLDTLVASLALVEIILQKLQMVRLIMFLQLLELFLLGDLWLFLHKFTMATLNR